MGLGLFDVREDFFFYFGGVGGDFGFDIRDVGFKIVEKAQIVGGGMETRHEIGVVFPR